jgi:ABC-type uncharacterized transport system substrate-binding protein
MSEPYLREGLASLTDSSSLMQMIGRKAPEEGVKLLEAAVAHVAEYAEPPKIGTLLSDGKPKLVYTCPSCQFEGSLNSFRRTQ